MGFFKTLRESVFGPRVDFNELRKEGAIVVDVRTSSEYNSGHCKGSINIPLASLNKKVDRLKNKTIILVCRSGMRAGQAKSILQKNGITAYNAGAWQNVK